MDNEALEREIEERVRQREIYTKTKAEAEIKEQSIIIQDPTKALHTKLNLKVAEHIDQSEEVLTQISNTADKLVVKGLQVQQNKATAEIIKSEDASIEADFEKNKAEYLYHGIDHKVDKQWKRNILLFINDIWFVVWAIVSFFTIVPISTFLSRINALKGFIKGVALVIGITMLLTCLACLTYGCLKWFDVLKFFK